MNKVCISGQVASDLNLKKTQTGKSVLSFSMKIDDDFNGKTITTYVDCTAWGQSAEKINTYAQKGQFVELSGRLSKSSYMNAQNVKVYKTEVIVSDVMIPNAQSNLVQNTYQAPKQPQYNNEFGGSFGDSGSIQNSDYNDMPF